MGSWLILAASSRGTRFFAVNQKPPARVPCASAGRRTNLSRSSCTLMDLCRLAQPRRRCVRCERPKCT